MYHPSRNYEDETDKKLIAMVQNFPGLYDSTVPDYRNPASTFQQWEIISRKLKMPSSEAEERWKYLRRRFTQTNGSTWRFHKDLEFLEPFIKRRKLSMNNSKKDDDVIIVREFKDEESDIPVKRKKKNRDNDEKSPEEKSIESFCSSIFSDLLKLPNEQILNCRIDILNCIQKYMGNPNLNTNNSVPDLMEHFVDVEKKIKEQRMEAQDPDWVFLYSLKNIFSRMMSLRNHSAELNDLFKNFQFVDQTNASNESVHDEANSFPTTTTQCSTNSYSEAEAKVTSSEVYFETTELKEILPPEVAALKENILCDGIVNNRFCNICNMRIINVDSHKKNPSHMTARRYYYLNFCIRNVDPLIFEIHKDKLRCRYCYQYIYSEWNLKKHISSDFHVRSTKSAGKSDSNCCNYIDRGILKIGTSFRFCLLCQENCFSLPHYQGHQHMKNLMGIQTVCRRNNSMFCFLCRKTFSIDVYERHVCGKEHRLHFKNFYEKNMNKYNC